MSWPWALVLPAIVMMVSPAAAIEYEMTEGERGVEMGRRDEVPQGPVGLVGNYLGDRVLDALGVFDVSVGTGPGGGLMLSLGLGHLGGYTARTYRLGIFGPYVGRWKERKESLGFFPMGILLWLFTATSDGLVFSRSIEQTAMGFGFDEGWGRFPHGWGTLTPAFGSVGPYGKPAAHSATIGFEVHWGIGLRAKIRPLAIINVATGFFGFHLFSTRSEEAPYRMLPH